jgi:hypothetical protein
VLLKKLQHYTVQRSLLEDQDLTEQGDDEYSVEDSDSQGGRTLTSGTPIDPEQDD